MPAVERLRPPSDRSPLAFDFRILSIDGGGIRGVIPARVLAALEAMLGTELERRRAAGPGGAASWAGIDTPLIADCFHLIAGTSTGGLLAAGLTNTGADGRPRLSAAQAAAAYSDHGAQIFHRPLLRNLFDHFGLFEPRYPLAQLQAVLELDSVLGPGLLSRARTDVLILAFDASRPAPRYFTRWGRPGAGGVPTEPTESMVEVALATAAAPTYFDPARLGAGRMVDGGVYAGNPSLAAIAMALRRTEAPAPRDPRELFMVSLGTGGWSAPLDPGSGGILGWLRPRTGGEPLLEAMLGGSGDFADEAAHLLLNGRDATAPGHAWEPALPPASIGGGPQLWRYQPPLPEPWGLDDVSKLAGLERIADELVARYRSELERLARDLIGAGPVPMKTASP